MKSTEFANIAKIICSLFSFLCFLVLSSCMINNRVAVRFDDIVAAASGRTASQIEKSIANHITEYEQAAKERRYKDVIKHLAAAVESIEKAFYLANDKYGSWRSPTVFTARELEKSERVNINEDLVEVYLTCLHNLVRYSLVTMDIDGYYRWFEKLVHPNKQVYRYSILAPDILGAQQLRRTYLFSLEASYKYFNEGMIDEAIKINEILKQKIETIALRSPGIWAAEFDEQGTTLKNLYDSATYMLATFYVEVGDLSKAGDVIKYLIGNTKDDGLKIKAFLTYSLIKDRFGEPYYSKLYLDKAVSIIESENNPEHVIGFLETISPIIIEKYLSASQRLMEVMETAVFNQPRSVKPDYTSIFIKRNAYLNAAHIFRKNGQIEKMVVCLAEFEKNYTYQLSDTRDSISFAEILALEGEWQKIVNFFWSKIDEFEYYREKISRSRYATTALKNVSVIFASLAQSIYSLDEQEVRGAVDTWPVSLGQKSDNKDEIAFKLIQLSKSRGILNALWGYKILSKTSSRKLKRDLVKLREDEVQLLREFVAGESSDEEIQSEKNHIHQKWVELRTEINRRGITDSAHFIYSLDFRDVHLSMDEAIIEYNVIGDSILYYVLENNDITLGILDAGYKELSTLIQEFYNISTSPKAKNFHLPARELLAKLINNNIGNFENIKTLYIAPDKILGIFPFDVMFQESTDETFAELQVTYTPSLSILEIMQAPEKQIKNRKAALMGDPVPLEISKELSYGRKTGYKLITALRGLLIKSKNKPVMSISGYASLAPMNEGWQSFFGRIPYTSVEIEKIAKLFKQKGYTAEILLRDDLTKSNVIALLDRKPKYVHFATHAIISHEIPYIMEPSLILSGDDKPIDHFLQSSEIEELDLRGIDLVVLSACKTGIDLTYDNEGISGIAKSFLIAGVKNVILTLWSIDDRATSKFMLSLYREILKGQNINKALSGTRRQFISSDDFSHPYFWGPFVLYGAK